MSVELSGVLFWFLEAISSREREREKMNFLINYFSILFLFLFFICFS